MAMTNHPEKPFFDQIVALETEIAERRVDLKAVYASAKENDAIGKDGVKTLRKAVKRHMEDPDKRADREALEQDADILRHRLGVLVDLPLGAAAVMAAKEAAE